MKFSANEREFIKDVLGMDVNEDETRGSVLREVQDRAFDVEIDLEYGDVDEETGELAADLVTKLGGHWSDQYDPNH